MVYILCILSVSTFGAKCFHLAEETLSGNNSCIQYSVKGSFGEKEINPWQQTEEDEVEDIPFQCKHGKDIQLFEKKNVKKIIIHHSNIYTDKGKDPQQM